MTDPEATDCTCNPRLIPKGTVIPGSHHVLASKDLYIHSLACKEITKAFRNLPKDFKL